MSLQNLRKVASTQITAAVAGVQIDIATLAPGARSVVFFLRNTDGSEHAYLSSTATRVAGDAIVPADSASNAMNGMWTPAMAAEDASLYLTTAANTSVVDVDVWASTGSMR